MISGGGFARAVYLLVSQSWFVGYFIRIVSSVGAILNIPNAGECDSS